MATKTVSKTVTDVIAGALDVFTRGPRGGKLRKARWNNHTLRSTDDDGNQTYCALGALAEATKRLKASSRVKYQAERLVQSSIPKSFNVKCIPDWNDGLSAERGFASIKRVFCKALKTSMGISIKKRRTKRGR